MLSYYVIYYEKLRKVMPRTEKVVLSTLSSTFGWFISGQCTLEMKGTLNEVISNDVCVW